MLKLGDKIKLLAMPQDPDALPAGATGTVTWQNPYRGSGEQWTQYRVAWDAPHEKRSLMIVIPPDQVEVIG